MAADLHIHVVTIEDDIPLIEEYLTHEFSLSRGDGEWHYGYNEYYDSWEEKWVRTFDVDWEDDTGRYTDSRDILLEHSHDELDAAVNRTEDVWVGEVSWLKAAFLEDSKTFIPQPVLLVSELIPRGWLTTIDVELIDKVAEALMVENQTQYALSTGAEVINFLAHHKGRKAFNISW